MELTHKQEAAVATIIAAHPEPSVLVLKRNTNPHDPWSGHYSFPGGRREDNDPSLLATCIRETREECGIHLENEHLIKQYPVRLAGNSVNHPIPVTTFLFEVDTSPLITLQKAEISGHEWLPLAYAANASNIVKRPMSPRLPGVLFPGIPAHAGVIWGFTYETLMLVIADRYTHNS